MHLIRIYNIINFCMLLQQEMAGDFLVSYQSWDKKGICWRDKENNCQRFLIYLLDKCGVRWKLTEQYLPRNVSLVAFQGPKKAHHLDTNRLSGTSVWLSAHTKSYISTSLFVFFLFFPKQPPKWHSKQMIPRSAEPCMDHARLLHSSHVGHIQSLQ
jgi:hypothetical protein